MRQNQKIRLSFAHRLSMLLLYCTQFLLYGYFNLQMIHYCFQPLPFIFSTPSLLSSPYSKPAYIWNAAVYCLFFLQHVIMSLSGFKLMMKSIWSSYPLYERYVYNICSSLVYMAIFSIVQPVSSSLTLLFTTPIILNYAITLISIIMLSISMLKFGANLMSPYPLSQILSSPFLQIQSYTQPMKQQLNSSGLFAYVRHPMQASILFLLAFGSNQYTIDRIIFIAVNWIGIFIGVYFQEKKLMVRFPKYGQYKQQVKAKFLPFLF